MSQGKPNLLKSIIALTMLSALEETLKMENKEDLLKENKEFQSLMDELGVVFGFNTKKSEKNTSDKSKSFFDEFKENEQQTKKANDFEEAVKFNEIVLPHISKLFSVEITYLNILVGKEGFSKLNIKRVSDKQAIGKNTAFFVNQIYKGFFIGVTINKTETSYEFSEVQYLTRNADGGYIEFRSFDEFIDGEPNKLIGLKELIFKDLKSGELK